MNWLYFSLVFLIFFCSSNVIDDIFHDGISSRRSSSIVSVDAKQKNWNKVDYDKLNRDWEEGDEDDELESNYDKNTRIAKKKLQEKMKNKKIPKFDPDNPQAFADAYKKNPETVMSMQSKSVSVHINTSPSYTTTTTTATRWREECGNDLRRAEEQRELHRSQDADSGIEMGDDVIVWWLACYSVQC